VIQRLRMHPAGRAVRSTVKFAYQYSRVKSLGNGDATPSLDRFGRTVRLSALQGQHGLLS